VTSARDLDTPVSDQARTAMSGLRRRFSHQPMWIRCAPSDEPRAPPARPGGLVHFTTNFQATSTIERARAVIETGRAALHQAHIFKTGGGITMPTASMPRTATISNGFWRSWTTATAMLCGGLRLRRWPADVGDTELRILVNPRE